MATAKKNKSVLKVKTKTSSKTKKTPKTSKKAMTPSSAVKKSSVALKTNRSKKPKGSSSVAKKSKKTTPIKGTKTPLHKTAKTSGLKKTKVAKGTSKLTLTTKPTASKGSKAKAPSKPATGKGSTGTASKKPKGTAWLKPLDDRLLIEVADAETTTPGGIILVDTTTQPDNLEGFVMAVGRGHQNKKGRIRPVEVKTGDKIIFSKYAGDKISHDGVNFVIIRESDVLGFSSK